MSNIIFTNGNNINTAGGNLTCGALNATGTITATNQTVTCGALTSTGITSTGAITATGQTVNCGALNATGAITATGQTVACGALTSTGITSTGAITATGQTVNCGALNATGTITATGQTVNCGALNATGTITATNQTVNCGALSSTGITSTGAITATGQTVTCGAITTNNSNINAGTGTLTCSALNSTVATITTNNKSIDAGTANFICSGAVNSNFVSAARINSTTSSNGNAVLFELQNSDNDTAISTISNISTSNGFSGLALASNMAKQGAAEVDYVCVLPGLYAGGHRFLTSVKNTTTATLGSVTCGSHSATSYANISDKRMKRDILSIGSTLEILLKMNPITFNYNFDASDCPVRSGFIAQEIEELLPNCVSDSGYDNTIQDNVKSLKIVELIPYIVKSVQEQNVLVVFQSSQITDLQTTIASQQSQIDSLTQQLADLKALVQTLLPNP